MAGHEESVRKNNIFQLMTHVSKTEGLDSCTLPNRQTEAEVGRQHQGMDRPGVRQVQEGSGEQGKMEKTGCKIICGAPTTLKIKG